MSKKLTPLKALKLLFELAYGREPSIEDKGYAIIENELKEYEKLKKEVNEISDFGLKAYREELEKQINSNKKYRTTNKRLRVKNQKLYEILGIIKEKRVDVQLLKDSKNLNDYNWCVHTKDRALTQEEYDLLKEVLLWNTLEQKMESTK